MAHARYLESMVMANCVETLAAEILLKNDSLEKRTLNGEKCSCPEYWGLFRCVKLFIEL